MANYVGVCRSNYFEVVDEERYQELFAGLTSEDLHDFTKQRGNKTLHGFGSYGSIGWHPQLTSEDEDSDFDFFLTEVGKILKPRNAVVVYEIGAEKLRYILGYVTIAFPGGKLKYMSLHQWAEEQCKLKLGESYILEDEY